MDDAQRDTAVMRTVRSALAIVTVLCGLAYVCAGFSTFVPLLFLSLMAPGVGSAALFFLQAAFGGLLIACGYVLVAQRRTRDLLRFVVYPAGGLVGLFAVLWALQDVIDVIEEIYY